MNRQIALAIFLVGLSSVAWGQTTVSEALPGGYPDPQCTRPRASLVKPQIELGGKQNAVDSGAVGAYNARVKSFNQESAAYNSCMHAYIDKANLDVKNIQDKANADLKQISERANASMNGIQDKIRQAVADANEVSAAWDKETARLRKQ